MSTVAAETKLAVETMPAATETMSAEETMPEGQLIDFTDAVHNAAATQKVETMPTEATNEVTPPQP